MKKNLTEIRDILWADQEPRNLIAGFDGFIDEIIYVVATRYSEDRFLRLEKISDFALKISAASELSTNIELVPRLIKIGGNGVIMANALVETGMNVNYIGSLGKPDIHPVFADFSRKCLSVTSLCPPGHTDALEFNDGKLMLGKNTSLNNVNWENIITALGYERIAQMTADADLIAITNWTMLLEMNSIIAGFNDLLKKISHSPFLFIDLADPAKRSSEDIYQVLTLIISLSHISKTILGMNKKESLLIASFLDIEENNLALRAAAIQQKLNLYAAVIHPVYGAAAATEHSNHWVDGPHTPTPALTTGAGDNFNAGFCLGLLLNMSLENALYTGVYTSGYYVRKAQSPTRLQLIHWLTQLSHS